MRVSLDWCRFRSGQLQQAAMSETIRDFRDLVAWQRALDLAVLVRDVCRKLLRDEWELASQMRRVATPVHSNIAEGNGRAIADYLRGLYMSRSSLNELESDLLYVRRCYSARVDAQPAIELAMNTRRPLFGLIRELEKKKNGER